MKSSAISRAAAVQFPVRQGDVEGNLQRVMGLLPEGDPRQTTLVALPELWGTGFDYLQCRELALKTPYLLDELQRLAGEKNLVFAGSLLESGEERNPSNTLFVVNGEGVVGKYRKQHLFALWKEDRFFTPGTRPHPVSLAGNELGGLVCYDLRFPELAACQAFAGAELFVVSAQWPLVRLAHWRILLQARAIENQCFVVAANSCGVEGQVEFAGHSMIVAPDGTILAEADEAQAVVEAEVSTEQVAAARSSFCSRGERPWPGRDQDKICSLADLTTRLGKIRKQGARVVFTNGCFDLLHAGHASYLEQARATADLLVVGLNTDRSVRELKGPSRPVNSEMDRARVLAGLGCVDFVVLFDEDTPLRLIRTLQPDVLVKGADWPEEKIVGAAEVKAAGGRVERIAFIHDRSTTALIEKIQSEK